MPENIEPFFQYDYFKADFLNLFCLFLNANGYAVITSTNPNECQSGFQWIWWE